MEDTLAKQPPRAADRAALLPDVLRQHTAPLPSGVKGRRVWSSVRVRVLAFVFACVLFLAAAIVGSVFSFAAASLASIERDVAASNVQAALRAIDEEASALRDMIHSWTEWDILFNYMMGGDPQGSFFSDFTSLNNMQLFQLSGMLFFLPNATARPRSKSNAPPLTAKVRDILTQRLLSTGEVYDIIRDPETRSVSLIVSSPIINGGNITDFRPGGWLMFTRDVQMVLPKVASTSNLCLALFGSLDEVEPCCRPAWSGVGETSTFYGNFSEDMAGARVLGTAEASRAEPRLKCSKRANVTDSSYLIASSIINNFLGDTVAYLYIQMARPTAHLITETERNLVVVSLVLLGCIVVSIGAILELAAIRRLRAFTSRIVEIGYGMSLEERMRDKGKSELHTVAKMVDSLLDKLHRQKTQTDVIMRNTFPMHVIQELRNGAVPCDHFKEVSFLYADICNFTLWSSRTPAKNVAGFLNELFLDMDTILERYVALKVCTIGDAYVLATGIPQREEDDAQKAALCSGRKMDKDQDLLLRIGIATGSCSASLVGSRKFKYETSADPGMVLCCPATAEKLEKDRFNFGSCRSVEAGDCTLVGHELASAVFVPASQDLRTSNSSAPVDVADLCQSPGCSNSPVLKGKQRQYTAEAERRHAHGSRASTLLHSLRFRQSTGLVLLTVVAIGVLAGVLAGISRAADRKLLHDIGQANVERVASLLVSAQSQVMDTAVSWAIWDRSYNFMLYGEYGKSFWDRNFGDRGNFYPRYKMDSVLFIMRNGTLRKGTAWSYLLGRERVLEDIEVRVIADYLLQNDRFLGVMTDPTTNVSRMVAACRVAHDDGTGDHIGWLVMTRDIRIVLAKWAYDSGVCVGVLNMGSAVPPELRSLWSVSEDRSTFISTNDQILSVPAFSVKATLAHSRMSSTSPLGGAALACPGDANLDGYIASGATIANATGGTGFMLFTGQSTQSADTQRAALWNIAVIDVCIMGVAPLLCIAAMELFFFRPLSSLCRSIASVAHGQRVAFNGIGELRDVARSVNFLLDSLEKAEGHIYQALLSGHHTSEMTETFENVSILFSEVVGFSKWASTSDPQDVLMFVNDLVAQYDDEVERHPDVIKIKTILDIYSTSYYRRSARCTPSREFP
eukprot:m51a1_g2531 hypothetical protein (1134) ;mRNA; f:241826-246344